MTLKLSVGVPFPRLIIMRTAWSNEISGALSELATYQCRVGEFQSLLQSYFRLPPERVNAAAVHQFSWCTVGFGCVPRDFSVKPNNRPNQLGQLTDRDIASITNID